jgi:hypothetical protein
MIGSWPLTPQPTARETREIVFRLGHELTARGARVRHDVIGGFRFSMPLLRHGREMGALRAMTSGRVTIGADSGEPWRVRYDLRFSLLTLVAILLSVGLIAIGYNWPRGRLFDVLVVVWIVTYGIPCARAMRMFRRLVRTASRPSVG